MLRALTEAADRRGITRLSARRVVALERAGSRIESLRLEDGGRVSAAATVIAAGWWTTGLLAPLGARLPVRPARGQLLAVELRVSPPPTLLACGETLLIPRPGDRMWIGSSVEYGADPQPTATARQRLLGGAAALIPALETAPIVGEWTGIRPCSSVHRPIVDRIPGLERAFVATGHHRRGYLLAPITAAAVAAMVLGEPPPIPMRPLCWR